MKPETLLRFKALAQRNEARRLDPRFLETMGFLVAKGFLGYNRPIPEKPNARLDIQDAIWAGKNVEPRILEVLPAALARLKRHFLLPKDPGTEERNLIETAHALEVGAEDARAFLKIPYAKLKVWMNLPLKDRRTRIQTEKKRLKTFRLHPTVIQKLAQTAKSEQVTEAEILERLITGLR